MRVFISYSNEDGLQYTRQARGLIKAEGHEVWLYEHDRTPGALTWEEIPDRIANQSDHVFFIWTPSSAGSRGQRLEIGYTLTHAIQPLVVPLDKTTVPTALSPFNYERWQREQFSAQCGHLAANLTQVVEKIWDLTPASSEQRSKDGYAERRGYLSTLNRRVAQLDQSRVEECRRAVEESYSEMTIVPFVARVAQEPHPEPEEFVTIGTFETTGLEEFNSPSYWWGGYFSDLGRSLAAGEQAYLQEFIRENVEADRATLSRSEPEYELLESRLEELSRAHQTPNILLAPIEHYVSFTEFFGSRLDWTSTRERLTVGGTELSIVWSHRYAPSASYVALDSRAGT